MSNWNNENQNKWNELYYGGLVGAKCLAVSSETDENDDGCWTRLVFEKDGKQFVVEISRDEEGNGPGFLFGLPMVPDDENPFLKDLDKTK